MKKLKNKTGKQIAETIDSLSKYKFLLLFIALLLSGFSYTGALNNGFTNWDDKNYIIENPDIRGLSAENAKKAFSSYVMGNYHPLTMLSYCIDYSIAELKPKTYLVHNLLFHLFNTALVFFFIQLLSGRALVSFITALLFGIHPMHVESVAWVAERKDLMYTFFYLGSLILYLLYLKKEKNKGILYGVAIFFFLLSLLSKGMAVSLTAILFVVDYFLGRKISVKTILEKIPFIILSVIFGIVAINAQKSAEAIDLKTFSFIERILFSSYGVLAYIWKLIVPVNLSCFYDYPVKQDGGYPAVYYMAPLLVAGLTALVFIVSKKSKIISFGFLFFFFSIALVLQVLPVGGAIIADRYTYVPYIGLFFIIAWGADRVFSGQAEKLNTLKPLILPAFGVICFGLVYLTKQQVEIWKDSITLWNNAITQYKNVPKMYNGRGDAYNTAKQYELAIKDFDLAIKLKSDYYDPYYNRGLAYYYLGKQEEAIRDYTLAIKYKPTLSRAYYNRAGSYFTLQRYKEALADAKKAQELGYPVEKEFFNVLEAALKVRK